MSHKPPRPVKPPVVATASVTEQERTALVHIEKGRFREAIACYKALLKIERRPQWMAGLTQAYSERAKSMADKGMLQEAIALWRSRTELCGTPLWEGPYAGWLISAGQLPQVLTYLTTQREAATAADGAQPDEIAALEAQLAPALLNADAATLARLPAQSLLLQHRESARAALMAYSNKDDPALQEALAGIPFRSPYRDLRSVLKALLLWETDPQAARLALARLPPDGPFEPLAQPLRTQLLSGMARLRHWAALPALQQTLVLDGLGYPDSMAPLLRALAVADKNIAPAALFDLVQRNSRDVPVPLATQVWQWLAPWATRRGCASPRLFGSPTQADQDCATALAVEIKGEWSHAEEHWEEAADQLAASKQPAERLRAALVLRHIALSPAHLSRDDALDEDGEAMLTRSLEFDVADCSVYVHLVRYWQRHDNLKRARELLEAGLAHFPDDVALLTEAVEISLAANAFKKAATTARQLLQLDPLNRKVRSLLGNAHLSHALKHLKADKSEAAHKEIVEAANWLESATDQGRLQLLQAWTARADNPERLRLAQLAVTTWGGGLAAGWRLMREALAAFATLNTAAASSLLRQAGIDPAQVWTPADVLELVRVLEQEPPMIRKSQDPLMLWRKAIAKLAATTCFDAPQTIRLCEAFSRHQERELLEKFADAARKLWPDQPVFVYHAVASRFDKHNGIRIERDFDDLETAQDDAEKNKDFRLASRIEALFDEDEALDDPDFDDSQDLPFLGMPKLPGKSGGRSSPFDIANINPQMIRHMLELTVNLDGGESLLASARQRMGEDVVAQLEKECGGDTKVLKNRLFELVAAEMGGRLGLPQPGKKNKPAGSNK